jgi:heat shock protein HslJ
MKKLTIGLIVLSVFILIFSGAVSGQDNGRMIEITPPYGEVVGEPIEQIWFVAHFTHDCMGVGPAICMQIKQNAEDEWQNYFGNIVNFAYVEGFSYELRVVVAELTNVPADASSQFVQLVEIMSKRSVNAVVGRDWHLQNINGEGVPSDVTITLTIAADGNINGSGGCNNYFASYELVETQISIGAIGATRMACAEGMDLEMNYLTTLEQVTAYTVDSSQLMLMNAAGEVVLTFGA